MSSPEDKAQAAAKPKPLDIATDCVETPLGDRAALVLRSKCLALATTDANGKWVPSSKTPDPAIEAWCASKNDADAPKPKVKKDDGKNKPVTISTAEAIE